MNKHGQIALTDETLQLSTRSGYSRSDVIAMEIMRLCSEESLAIVYRWYEIYAYKKDGGIHYWKWVCVLLGDRPSERYIKSLVSDGWDCRPLYL
jgi:hypothetical protein